LNRETTPKSAEQKKRSFGLLKRREVLVPTVRGWLILVFGLMILTILAGRNLHAFLSVNDSKPGGALVVEGWAPDYAMAMAVSEFRSNHYDKVYVTGIPLTHGAPLSEYGTYAELGAAVLVKMGLSTNVVQPVPTPDVKQDRTYTSAATLKKLFRERNLPIPKINIFTAGPHARRSRLLYQKALGKDVDIGVIATPIREYDPAHWWRSSPGFRDVTGEAMAYLYARIFFRTPKE
jgi:hypothetical protein